MTRVLPTIDIEMVNLAITAGSPLQVKATSTPCHGITIGAPVGGGGNVLISLSELGDQLILSSFALPITLPIADASLLWVDVAAGIEDVNVLILK